MKIAIDIDGVIYDTQKYIMIYSEIFDIDELHRNSLVKLEEFWSNVRYSWSEEETQKFFGFFYFLYQLFYNLFLSLLLYLWH